MSASDLAGLDRLYLHIVALREVAALKEVADLLVDGVEPMAIMDCFHRGLTEIGRLFQIKEYYMTALVLAGDLMSQSMRLVMPRLAKMEKAEKQGLVLVATIEGDIHELGKSLAGYLLTASGFEVVDLGVDVPPRVILAETLRLVPDVVGVSLLLTTCVPTVRRLSGLIDETFAGQADRPLLLAGCGFNIPKGPDERGGGLTDLTGLLGVDMVVADAYDTVRICLERMGSRKRK
ncbi:MAG: cobalamin-dependent protein [Deltaproteobacteria bacterium]|jgi:methanogenic corrinoid protein MtbC1|nr:cobalamin-dependent protein [Deltaproteobacteria bacterium]